MPLPDDTLIISSEHVPDGYVSLLNGPVLAWYGKIKNMPKGLTDFNRVVVSQREFYKLVIEEETKRIAELEKQPEEKVTT